MSNKLEVIAKKQLSTNGTYRMLLCRQRKGEARSMRKTVVGTVEIKIGQDGEFTY